MFWSLAARRLSCALAIFAVLLGSLAPAISHALNAIGDGAGAGMEVCTALGAKWVNADDAKSGRPAPAPAHLLEHCLYCSLQAQLIGLPPPPVAVLHAPLLSFEVPQRFLSAPHTAHAWIAALSRAPPALS